MGLKLIPATRAREMSDVVNQKGSIYYSDLIVDAISKGNTYVYLDFPLNESSVQQLEENGYTLTKMSQIAIQKEVLYYKISW